MLVITNKKKLRKNQNKTLYGSKEENEEERKTKLSMPM